MYYSVIFKNSSPIADYSDQSGDFGEILTNLWKANRQNVEYYTLHYQKEYEFCFLQEDVYTFACIVNQNTDSEKVLQYLQEIKRCFMDISHKNNLVFEVTILLKDFMNKYQDLVSNDKLAKIESDLEEIAQEKKQLIKTGLIKDLAIDNLETKSENIRLKSKEVRIHIGKKLEKTKQSNMYFYIVSVIVAVLLLMFIYFKVIVFVDNSEKVIMTFSTNVSSGDKHNDLTKLIDNSISFNNTSKTSEQESSKLAMVLSKSDTYLRSTPLKPRPK